MKLITLSGVDGSGKSTQLKLLKDTLEQNGKKVFYFHAVEFSFINRLAHPFKGKRGFIAGEDKAVTQTSWPALQLRKLFLWIDILRFKSLLKKLEQEGYDYILSDRYFYDSVINILYLEHILTVRQLAKWRSQNDRSEIASISRQDAPPRSDTLSSIEQLIPRPDYALYMHITAEEILKRDRVPEQGIDYLTEKIALFEQKKNAYGLISIDASEAQDTLAKIITAKISI
jgi:thymidylate kinase